MWPCPESPQTEMAPLSQESPGMSEIVGYEVKEETGKSTFTFEPGGITITLTHR